MKRTFVAMILSMSLGIVSYAMDVKAKAMTMAREAQPGDDRGGKGRGADDKQPHKFAREAEPGDKRQGREAEPGDDRGGKGRGADD